MFYYLDEKCRNFQNNEIDGPDSFIIINSHKIDVIREICILISQKLEEIYEEVFEPEEEDLTFVVKNVNDSYILNDIEKIFNGDTIQVHKNNAKQLMKIAEFFEIESLTEFLSNLIFDKNIIKSFIKNPVIKNFTHLEKAILLIYDENNIKNSVKTCHRVINKIGEQFFIRCFFTICEKSLLINLEHIVKFIKLLKEKNPSIIDSIIDFYENGSEMVKENKLILSILYEFFRTNYIAKDQINQIFKNRYPFTFIDFFGTQYYHLDKYDLSAGEKMLLEENNFDDHIKGIIEGHCQDSILILIRQDNFSLLQDFTNQNQSFDPEIPIKKCEYEKIRFINDNECNLINYSAFFGSIKCFNYLTMNSPNYDSQKCLKYAIAGNSYEIILKIIQSELSLKNHSQIASAFHHHNLVEWILLNHYDEYSEDLMYLTLKNYNFVTLLYILQKGIPLFDLYIGIVMSNNYVLLKNLIEILPSFQDESYINTPKENVFRLLIKLYFLPKEFYSLYKLFYSFFKKIFILIFKTALHIACENNFL